MVTGSDIKLYSLLIAQFLIFLHLKMLDLFWGAVNNGFYLNAIK